MHGLDAKRILVAGGASGIGAATARRLGREGASVVIGDLNFDGAQEVAHEVAANGGTATAERFDLSDGASVEAMVSAAAERLDGLDGVVSVAADFRATTIGRDTALTDMSVDVWEQTLRANLIGYALIARATIPYLVTAGGGAVVNISSDASWIGEALRPAYAASKAGVNALTRHIASAYGSQGIRANAVSPGLVLSDTALTGLSEEVRTQTLASIAAERLGRPDDLASTIAFLLSDDAEWVSGQVWSVNGGGGFRD